MLCGGKSATTVSNPFVRTFDVAWYHCLVETYPTLSQLGVELPASVDEGFSPEALTHAQGRRRALSRASCQG